MIQILVALFINFRALKVVKWARMLPAAANPVSVDPSKNGTKRSGSEEVEVLIIKSYHKLFIVKYYCNTIDKTQ